VSHLLHAGACGKGSAVVMVISVVVAQEKTSTIRRTCAVNAAVSTHTYILTEAVSTMAKSRLL
jgi:hypothetical protein